MFEKISEMFKSKENPEARAIELVRLLAHEVGFLTPEEKAKLGSGEKLEAQDDIRARYGEALALLEQKELSPATENMLAETIESIEEVYLIG